MQSNPATSLARINCRARFLRGLNSALPNAPLDRILEESNIPLEGLYETGLTAEQYARLLRCASGITNNPLLPMLVGVEAELVEFGIYGYSLLSSPDHKHMTRVAVEYQRLAGYGFEIRVVPEENRLLLKIEDNPALPASDNLLLVLEFLGANDAIIRGWFTPPVHMPVVAAELSYAEPDEFPALSSVLAFPIHFDRAGTTIHLNRDILSVDIDHQGAELNMLFLHRCEAEMARLQSTGEESLESRVRSLIYQALQGGVPTQADIAGQLHLSPRTMNRRLSEQGTSFIALLTQCRMSLARELLTDEDLSVQEIAYRLGYAQPNSFYRAYRKHYGGPPRAKTTPG
jgi:AraC-like DNA-binding protein